MKYKNIEKAIFLERLNRFVALVEIDGEKSLCHVKNTGRLRELLVPGSQVWVQRSDKPGRKTAIDLITVKNGDRLVNIDSNAPNALFAEYARKMGLFELLKPEQSYGGSRFDFYAEKAGARAFIEVKGVTLLDGETARFPDAPTQRGIKHLQELGRCVDEGYEAYIVFIIAMKGARRFSPNEATHPEFAAALREAAAKGVRALAFDCVVGEGSIEVDKKVDIILGG